jgi:L,D-peptidoglycan transpeptidase YkuD (ErfK/YbiS/YcfS/YnhG family)
LANELESTGKARQLVTVEAATSNTSLASVALWQRTTSRSCWKPAGGPWSGLIGANGFSDHHREGDGTTPTGFYGIGPIIYGNAPDPGTKEPYHRLVCGDWWDEDARSPEYNTFQHVPCGQTPQFGGDSEALWTETSSYPSLAVVEYNTAPVVPYAGSGIFIHAGTGTPTIGCVAIPLPDLDYFLRWLEASRSPAVVMGPSHEITHF